MRGINAEGVGIHFDVCLQQYIGQSGSWVADAAAIHDGVAGKNDRAVIMIIAICIEGKIKIGIAEVLLYRCYIIIKLGNGGSMEFLQAKNISVLLVFRLSSIKRATFQLTIRNVPGSFLYEKACGV
jgi:hypothetical protein